MSPPKRKRLSPQQKKSLSRARDRRNDFGQNDKASRKAIPLRKKLANRKLRHADKTALKTYVDEAEITPARRKPDWQKAPDQPLAEWIKSRQKRRAESVGAKQARRRDRG